MQIPKAIWFILGLGLLLNIVAIVIAIRNPAGNSYPQVIQTPVAQVDYSKISDIISQQIASLPKPQDGANGLNGLNGSSVQGAQGIPGQNATPAEIASAVSAYLQANPPAPGATGSTGAQGEPGAAGETVELRYNITLKQIQWKYTTDFTWRDLVDACTLTNTCSAT